MSLRAVLLDVEGVTTSVRFVKDVLFPFARKVLPTYLREHAQEATVQALSNDVARVAAISAEPEAVARMLERWSDEDRKEPSLKALQGLVWEDGYHEGILVGHVYADVPDTLAGWRRAGLRIGIYSSGSVQAQKGLFGHTAFGDLRSSIDAWFDTAVGGKKLEASYRRLAAVWGLLPSEIVFLSDDEGELDAAALAGLRAVLVQRGDGVPGRHETVKAPREVLLPTELGSTTTTDEAAHAVVELARACHARGWADATSGNFSAKLEDGTFLVTGTGLHKGELKSSELVRVDAEGKAVSLTSRREPSAETPLHAQIYGCDPAARWIAHTHSVAATVLSAKALAEGALSLGTYEMLKAVPWAPAHGGPFRLAVLPNEPDLERLRQSCRAAVLAAARGEGPPAYLIEGHGLTTWAADVGRLTAQVEALEFVLRCVLEHARA